MGKDQKDLPLPDPELEKPDPELPKPEKDLPLPEKEIPAKNTDGKKSGFPIYKSFIFGFIFILVISLLGLLFFLYQSQNKSIDKNEISSYEECVEAGYPVMESYPEQCAVPDGPSFTRELTDEEKNEFNTTIDTSNWSDYFTDDFSFKYPDSWEITNESPTNLALTKSITGINSAGNPTTYDANINMNIYPAEAKTTLNEALNTYYPNDLISKNNEKLLNEYSKTTMLDGIDAIYFTQPGMASFNGNGIIAIYKDNVYVINLDGGGNMPEINAQEALDGIISTFKFIDEESSTDTANWQTFSNNSYKFQYPPSWTISQKDYLNSIDITNSKNTVAIRISDDVYTFESEKDNIIDNKNITIFLNDESHPWYTQEHFTEDQVYVRFGPIWNLKHSILFGSMASIGLGANNSISDYQSEKETILQILNTLAFTE